MTPRELADRCEAAPGFDDETLQELADTLRAQADEIDALRAAAIVASTVKLAEWARLETQLCARAQQVKNLMVEIQRLKTIGRQMCQALGISTDMDEGEMVRACEQVRARLALAKRVVKAVEVNDAAVGAWANANGEEKARGAVTMYDSRLELDEALAAWEEGNG